MNKKRNFIDSICVHGLSSDGLVDVTNLNFSSNFNVLKTSHFLSNRIPQSERAHLVGTTKGFVPLELICEWLFIDLNVHVSPHMLKVIQTLIIFKYQFKLLLFVTSNLSI